MNLFIKQSNNMQLSNEISELTINNFKEAFNNILRDPKVKYNNTI